MKKLLVVGLLIVVLAFIGCVGLQLGEKKHSLESLIERSKSMPLDKNGWGVLAIPSKETKDLEYIFWTKRTGGDTWDSGFGLVKHGPNGGALLLAKYNGKYFFIESGFPVQVSEQDALEIGKEFWKDFEKDMDFDKAHLFIIHVTPAKQEQI